MKKTGLLFLFMLLGHLLRAQTDGSPSTKSMDANEKTSGSMQGTGKPGDIYSVNLYDGTASVTIPIFSNTVDGLDVGVSVSYDTRGQKVDAPASAVGAGWSLYAGGYITRIAHGMEDELTLPTVNKRQPPGSQYTVPALPESRGNLVQLGTGGIMQDKEYDEFEASFCGRTVRFMMGPCLTGDPANPTVCTCDDTHPNMIVTYPKSEITVKTFGLFMQNWGNIGAGAQNNASGKPDSTKHLGFVITDEKGSQFFFVWSDYQRKWRSDTGDITDAYFYYPTEKWMLTRIITKSWQVINFDYGVAYNVNYPNYRDEQIREVQAHDENDVLPHVHYNDTLQRVVDSTARWIGAQHYLTKITYPNGIVAKFNYDPAERCDLSGGNVLTSIQIQNGYGVNWTNTLTYRFNYAYFHSPTPGNSATELPYGTACSILRQQFGYTGANGPLLAARHQELGLRLKLNSIDKIGFDNTTTERYYTFAYNSLALPERLSPSKDFYGYFNGGVSTYTKSAGAPDLDLQNSSIPLHTFTFQNGNSYTYGINKTPDLTNMQAFNLTTVTNGLGGTVAFAYKAHDLYRPANAYNNGTAVLPNNYEGETAYDGLCIDNIIVTDGYNNDNTSKTVYSFEKGQQFFRGGYYWLPEYYDYNASFTSVNNRFAHYMRRYYSNMISPRLFIGGSNHGYTYATVSRFGYGNALLGSEKYHFSNLMDEDDTTKSNLAMRVYGDSTNFYGPKMMANAFNPDAMHQYKMGLILDVSSYSNTNTLLSKTTNTYQTTNFKPWNTAMGYKSNVMFTYRVTTGYESKSQYYSPIESQKRVKTSSTTTNYYPNGQTTSTTMNYVYDANDNLTSVNWTDSKGRYCKKNYLFYPATTQYLWGSLLWVDGNLISRQSMESGINSNAKNSRVMSDFYSAKINKPVSYADFQQNNYLMVLDKQFTFDSSGNVIQTNYESGKSYTAAIWDTAIGQKICEVANAQYSDIAYTSFEGPVRGLGAHDYSKGNWNYDPNLVVNNVTTPASIPALTGRCYYALGTGPLATSSTLENGKTYIVTVWSNVIPRVGTMGNLTVWHSFPSPINTASWGPWSLYSTTIVGDGSQLTIFSNSSMCRIDELRLYPVEASMTTTTYEPMIGPSSQCDAMSNIHYIEYDAMGRAKLVRDIDKNIISATKTVVQGQDN